MPKALELAGHKFGHLTAVRCVGSQRRHRLWLCICDRDHNEVIVLADSLRNGRTKSCGHCPNEVAHDLDGTLIFMESQKGEPRVCIIDTADYPLVQRHHWYAYKPKGSRTFYAVAHLDENDVRTAVHMHTLLLPEAETVDHINFNGMDNRRQNLRPANHSEQTIHTRKQRNVLSSKLKGVDWDKKRAAWRARFANTFLGYFESEEDAGRAYDIAAFTASPDFAVLNFPERINEPPPIPHRGRKLKGDTHGRL